MQNQINTLSGVLYNVAINNTFNNLYANSYNDKLSTSFYSFNNGSLYLYNDVYNLKFQTDGNLVIYTNSNNSVIFNTLGTNNNIASNTTNITNNTNSINSIEKQLNSLYTISGFLSSNNIIQTQLNTLSSVINIVASNNTFYNLNVTNFLSSGNINCANITSTIGDYLLVDNIAGITNVYGYRYLQLYDMINIYDGMVVGYGSSSPQRLPINTIDVNGSIGATYYYNNIGKSSDTAQWFGFNNSSLGGIQMTYYNYWLILQGDRNLVLYDKSSGSQVAVWNSGTSVSDRNFKKNIVNTSISGIHSIKKINIVDYQYIESFEPDNKIRVGVIAQDLLHIVPEAVKWFDNPNYSISGTISGSISGSIYTDQLPGNYVVNLDRIVPYLIKGMQEQQVIIDSLVNRISILENKIL